MATRITITADGDQAKKEIREVAGSMDRLQDDAVDAGTRAANALERIEDALEDIASQSRKTDAALEKVGGGNLSGKITAVATSFTSVGQALELGGEASRAALDAINFLADSGSPSAIRLRDSIKGVQDALIALADDPRVAGLADQLSGIGDGAADTIASLPDLYTAAVNRISGVMVSGMEAVGLAAEGTSEELAKIQEQEARALDVARERIAAERERLEIERQKTELAKGLRQIEEASEAASRQAALAKIDDQAEILRLIREQRDALQKLAEDGKLNDDDRADGLRKLAELESRLQSIKREGEQAAERELQQREADEKRIADQKRAADEAALQRQRQAEQERQADANLKRKEEIASQQRELEKSGVVDAVQQAASDPRAIAETLAAQRAEQRQAELDFEGASEARIRREVEAARRQAFRQAMIQQRGGVESFTASEMASAQQQNVDAQLQTLRQSGQFGDATITALAQATQAQTSQGEEIARLTDIVRDLQKRLGENLQDSTRRRSQRNSSRQ